MQPQGHVQVLMNVLIFGCDPQRALDLPRICIHPEDEIGNNIIDVEDGISDETVLELENMGHRVRVIKVWDRSVFGRGQIIQKIHQNLYVGGSDGRGDGLVLPMLQFS